MTWSTYADHWIVLFFKSFPHNRGEEKKQEELFNGNADKANVVGLTKRKEKKEVAPAKQEYLPIS